jgi:hypothetical protein
MGLRSRRRDLATWSLSVNSTNRHIGPPVRRPVRTRRIRRSLRLLALLALLGAMRLARGARYRWQPLLAGAVLTATGIILHGSAWGVAAMAGIYSLWYAVLIPGRPAADRRRHSELKRELAGYSTAAQRADFVAMLDRYPDDATYELRDILTHQAMPACSSRMPGAGRS